MIKENLTKEDVYKIIHNNRYRPMAIFIHASNNILSSEDDNFKDHFKFRHSTGIDKEDFYKLLNLVYEYDIDFIVRIQHIYEPYSFIVHNETGTIYASCVDDVEDQSFKSYVTERNVKAANLMEML